MTKITTHYIIDFDSTFIKVEAFDELCILCYPDKKKREEVLNKVKDITNKGMNGELTITESLQARLLLLKAHKEHLAPLVEVLKEKVSASFQRNKSFLKENSDSIYIVSNGFVEFIMPIVVNYGIKAHKVFANSFEYDEKENIVGFDKTNILSEHQGKSRLVAELELEGEIVVIGDGYTDFEILETGVATQFFAFTENVSRENVTSRAQNIAASLEDVINSLQGAQLETNESISNSKK